MVSLFFLEANQFLKSIRNNNFKQKMMELKLALMLLLGNYTLILIDIDRVQGA